MHGNEERIAKRRKFMIREIVSPGTTNRANGVKAASVRDRNKFYYRAVESAIWAMPIVSTHAMRQAFFRDAKARYGDIVYWSKPADWKARLTTADASCYYVYSNFNTRNGPIVIQLPEVKNIGLSGTLLDAWQVPHADVGPDGED